MPRYERPRKFCVVDRVFPPPWTAEEGDAYFIVRDKSGQALAYVYLEKEKGLVEVRFEHMTHGGGNKLLHIFGVRLVVENIGRVVERQVVSDFVREHGGFKIRTA